MPGSRQAAADSDLQRVALQSGRFQMDAKRGKLVDDIASGFTHGDQDKLEVVDKMVTGRTPEAIIEFCEYYHTQHVSNGRPSLKLNLANHSTTLKHSNYMPIKSDPNGGFDMILEKSSGVKGQVLLVGFVPITIPEVDTVNNARFLDNSWSSVDAVLVRGASDSREPILKMLEASASEDPSTVGAAVQAPHNCVSKDGPAPAVVISIRDGCRHWCATEVQGCFGASCFGSFRVIGAQGKAQGYQPQC